MHPALGMSEAGLSGQLLPGHVKPQADELLSSWLTRLSLAHGLQPRAFCTILWPTKPIWTGDLDRRATPDMLSILAQNTATSRQRAFATTLSAYEGALWEGLDSSRSRHWLLLGAIQRQRRGRPGAAVLPAVPASRRYA